MFGSAAEDCADGSFLSTFPMMRKTTRRIFYGLGLVGALLVVGINGSVRIFGGGAPHLLSPLQLRNKVRALNALFYHIPAHVLRDSCEAKPQVHVTRAAKRHRVPVALALAMARTESSLKPHAISPAGAMGLLQLMPDTADHMKVKDPFSPAESANGGMKYMAWLLKRFKNDRRRAVAAYNAGPYAIPKRGRLKLSGETRLYVQRVLQRAKPKKQTTSTRGRGS